MSDSVLFTSADYADALLTARRAKDSLFALILLTLLFQLGVFLAGRYKVLLDQPSTGNDLLHYAVGTSQFLGIVLPIVLAAVLGLIALIMLVGRLIGVGRVVSAFVTCIVLIVILFPWQSFLMDQTFSSDRFRFPGVLYSWPELILRVRSHPDHLAAQWLFWARFVAWPVVALLLALQMQLASAAGLRGAMRKASAPTVVVETPPPGIVQ